MTNCHRFAADPLFPPTDLAQQLHKAQPTNSSQYFHSYLRNFPPYFKLDN